MLKYAGTPVEEQEVVIRIDAVDGQAHICSTWPRWSRKLETRLGCPTKYQEQNDTVQVAFWKVPLGRISIRSMPKPGRDRHQTGRFASQTATPHAISGAKSEKTPRRTFHRKTEG